MLRLLNIGLLLLTLLAFAVPWVNPSFFWPLSILGLLCPWLLLANLVMGLIWLSRRRWWLVGLSAAILLLGWPYLTRVFSFSSATETEGRQHWKLVSFNCHGFQYAQGGLVDMDEVAAQLAGWEADVICMQEVLYTNTGKAYLQAIREATGLRHLYHDGAGGLAVFSRYPLSGSGTEYFNNRANGYLYTDVALPGGPLRLYNIHLQTNAISGMAERVRSKGDLQEKETWLTIRGMFSRYGRSSRERGRQAREIARKAAAADHPAIICGDFNDVPISYVYQSLTQELSDAFTTAGRGMGATYQGALPGLRIDYILHDPQLTVADFTTLRSGFSDHRPVRATFLLPGTKN